MLKLEQIPMRQDNYSYALIKDQSVIMIDPSEPEASAQYFANNPHLKLTAILNTHSHIDHIGGNEILYKQWRCPIYGPALEKERIPQLSHPLHHQAELSLIGIRIIAFDVHAHTAGHMAFLIQQPIDEVVKHGHGRACYVASHLKNRHVMLVGDSLFAAGCGRLFEGTPQNLVDCLTFYNKQDPQIMMACAHEYTKANLRFAEEIFSDHKAIKERSLATDELLAKEGSTVPCLFALEFETNPFLLALKQPYQSRLAQKFGLNSQDLTGIIANLRKAKDDF